MSSALRTKLSATMSTPSCAPNFKSSMSFGVSASAESCTPGALIPLCSSSIPPSMHSRHDLATVSSLDLQLNLAVVEQQLPARTRLAHELGVRRVDELLVPLAVAGDDADGLPVLQIDRPPALQPAGPDFRAAQVLEDRHDFRRAGGGRANPVERLGVRVVCAVRKIQPADVDAGVDELLDDFVAATRRADRRNDLCVPHVRDSLHRNEARAYNLADGRKCSRTREARARRRRSRPTARTSRRMSALAPDGMLIVMEEDAARAGRDAQSPVERRAWAKRDRHRRRSAADVVQACGTIRCDLLQPPYLSVRPDARETARDRWSAHHNG